VTVTNRLQLICGLPIPVPGDFTLSFVTKVAVIPLQASRDPESSAIRVFGARTHNLRSLNVDIPIGRLTVITGVSGSGKSSLAFDTIFAEGRHRYLSTVSRRSRELLQGVDRPDVDFIDGLPPVVCVEQQLRGGRKRATVATLADLDDYLQLLYTRIGQLFCPSCQQPVTAQSRQAIVEQVLRLPERQKVLVMAPIVRGRSGTQADVFARIVKDGFVRARVDGELIDVTEPPEISKSKAHDIEIVVDRLIMKEGIRGRLEESIDIALQLGLGQCVISHEEADKWVDRLYSSKLACPACGTSFATLEPRTFSFNSPIGACRHCQGLGTVLGSDETPVVCEECQGTRFGIIPRSVRIAGTSITDFYAMSPAVALQVVDRWISLTTSNNANDAVTATTIAIAETGNVAARHILPEVAARLRFLSEVGLNYLTLNRGGESLSAGELQRSRLAACLGSELTSVCYILDEPTAGLSSRDTQRLLQILTRLRDAGNTVLLVEHDLDVIRAADHVIDLGPGAGVLGGQLLAAGTPEELSQTPDSITGSWLQKAGDQHAASASRSNTASTPHSNLPALRLSGATLHNLNDVTVEIPLQQIVCVTGVSGSGKTSLAMQTLVPAVRRALGESILPGGPFQQLTGVESLSRVIRIDQSPLGRSARSSPATYSGLWDDIRKVFAKTKEARLRGFSARRFSLSVPEARCPRCAGRGQLPVDEKRFADWSMRCPECDGRRFAPATLSIQYRGQSVADVLEMSIADAAVFFENFSRLARMLTLLSELGLGYLKLGQSAATLSGGEAQRIKLATELAKPSPVDGATLFVLDEPTSGLHVADVQQLVLVLRRLTQQGHSVLVIEHNTEFIAASDWIIEVGPGAGAEGGRIVSAGNRIPLSSTMPALPSPTREQPTDSESDSIANPADPPPGQSFKQQRSRKKNT